MNISARDVRELRERTGAGIMDCKRALAESAGKLEAAVDFLRKKGLSASAKKAGRLASEGAVGAYVHGAGKIGVLVEVNCETDFVGRNEDFQRFVRDVAMHVAAAAPTFVHREEVPAEVIAKEREIVAAQVEREVSQGEIEAPEGGVAALIDARMERFVAGLCLLEQPFVKDGKQSVGEVQNALVGKIGEKIAVRRFTRFQLGEGLEKRSENFLEEVQRAAAGA